MAMWHLMIILCSDQIHMPHYVDLAINSFNNYSYVLLLHGIASCFSEQVKITIISGKCHIIITNMHVATTWLPLCHHF